MIPGSCTKDCEPGEGQRDIPKSGEPRMGIYDPDCEGLWEEEGSKSRGEGPTDAEIDAAEGVDVSGFRCFLAAT